MINVTAKELIRAYYNKYSQRYELLVDNVYACDHYESDICGVRPSNFTDEIEVKISKSDYNADFKKVISSHYLRPDEKKADSVYMENNYGYMKHGALKVGRLYCNYFSFLMPDYIADTVVIPEYAGLYVGYINNNQMYISQRKKPVRLHKRKASIDFKYNLCKKLMWRYWVLNKG